MGEQRPALSKGELQVARVLWELGEASVRQVCEALPKGHGLEFATVQTYLRRLEAKGYIGGRNTGRTRIYKPRIKPRTVIRETLDDLIDRLFGGDTAPLVRHLIQNHEISGEELTELRELIEQMEQRRKRQGENES